MVVWQMYVAGNEKPLNDFEKSLLSYVSTEDSGYAKSEAEEDLFGYTQHMRMIELMHDYHENANNGISFIEDHLTMNYIAKVAHEL